MGLLMDLKGTKCFKNLEQGATLWKMHDNHQLCCVMWKDKKHVLLISTHALSIQASYKFLVITVPKQ